MDIIDTTVKNEHPIENNKIFDITDIQNDFIYKLVDYYLEEISLEPSDNIPKSITNLVDTIMSYYLLAKKNGVIDLTNSRKLLILKMGKKPNDILLPEAPIVSQKKQNPSGNDILLNQCQQLKEEFDELEKYLTKSINEPSNKNDQTNINSKSEFLQIDKLLQDHEKFMTDINKQSSDIKSIEKDFDFKNKILSTNKEQMNSNNSHNKTSSEIVPGLTPVEVIEKITELEKKLKEDMQSVSNTLTNKLVTSEKDKTSLDSILNTEEKDIIKKISNEILALPKHQKNGLYTSNGSSSTVTDNNMDKLDEAFKKLYSRLNTPLINLMIAVVILKITTYLFGF